MLVIIGKKKEKVNAHPEHFVKHVDESLKEKRKKKLSFLFFFLMNYSLMDLDTSSRCQNV